MNDHRRLYLSSTKFSRTKSQRSWKIWNYQRKAKLKRISYKKPRTISSWTFLQTLKLNNSNQVATKNWGSSLCFCNPININSLYPKKTSLMATTYFMIYSCLHMLRVTGRQSREYFTKLKWSDMNRWINYGEMLNQFVHGWRLFWFN